MRLRLPAGLAVGVLLLAHPAAQGSSAPQLPDKLASITFGEDPNGRPFTFHFSQPVPLERCSINCYQTGAFGGMGMPATPPWGAGMGSVYTIRTGSSGKPAKTLKAAIWCPGFANATVDVPDLANAKPEASIALRPLRNLTIAGTIRPSDDGVELGGAELIVFYEAAWTCGLFGQMDCINAGWEIGRVRIEQNGSFRIAVPDFINDPTVAKFRDPGSFRFRVSRSTPPHDYRLEGGSPGGDLAVAANYPPLRLHPRR